MKKLLLLTLVILVSLSLFGRPKENPRITDERVTDWILDQLRDAGYTVLPEVIVQDTLNRHKQKFSSRYETKGGRGMMMPDWAVDSTWSPGMKEPKKEWDDLYFNSKTDQQKQPRHRNQIDQIVDTLVKENPEIVVNNYYNDDPFYYSHNIGRFYHGGLNYWMYSDPFWYSNYWYYSNYDWSWEFRFMRNTYWPYSSFYFVDRYDYWGWNSWMYNPWRFNYYGHNNYNQYNNYYGNNNFNHNSNNSVTPQYGRRERPSNLTQSNPPRRSIQQTQPQQRNPQNMKQYSESRRSYAPSYETPRMSTRPNFNNSRINNGNNGTMRGNVGNMNNNTGNINMPNSRREATPQTRTYTPTQNREYSAPSRSYSEPTRNFNSGSDMGRRSSGSDFSNSQNYSGGNSRSSSGYSSSGSSNNSGGGSPTRR